MDSSSIVSFNNDSTLQNTLKPELNNVSVHELALHAMRDRCLLLQRRINALESDNMRLKLDTTKVSDRTTYIPLQEDEKSTLEKKVAELTKQKSQLIHHVFMVSCENKTLWNKLSNLKKIEKPLNKPLLRTNTYIHSTPKSSANFQEKFSESSLDEISLKVINSYIQEKSQLVEQYEQMTQLQDMDEDILNIDSIGFTYIEEPPTDSLKEIHIQTEKLQTLKKNLLQQEEDIKFVMTKLEKILEEGYRCPTCISRNAKITTSEHKEIETSDSLANFSTPVDSTNYNENFSEIKTTPYKKDSSGNDGNESQVLVDKRCPMCGQNFSKDVTFSEFQSHVENHFIGEIEPESIIDTYSNINSVGNII